MIVFKWNGQEHPDLIKYMVLTGTEMVTIQYNGIIKTAPYCITSINNNLWWDRVDGPELDDIKVLLL